MGAGGLEAALIDNSLLCVSTAMLGPRAVDTRARVCPAVPSLFCLPASCRDVHDMAYFQLHVLVSMVEDEHKPGPVLLYAKRALTELGAAVQTHNEYRSKHRVFMEKNSYGNLVSTGKRIGILEIRSIVPHIFPRAGARFGPPQGKESPVATWCRYGNATVVLRVVMVDSVTSKLSPCLRNWEIIGGQESFRRRSTATNDLLRAFLDLEPNSTPSSPKN